MQYEIGKTFETTGKPILCENGFHFCLNMPDVFLYYKFGKGNRYFEVEADDNVAVIGGNKCVTTRIRFIRELSNKEVNRVIYGNGYGYGHGHGYGNRYGDRCGDGDGRGDGYVGGYLGGQGDGDGNFGYGDGNGYGDGYGDGYGNGQGYGYNNINAILIWR
jgi:hypothetical protein